ncbi:MAG TPA: hypothetical protein PKO39_06900 [Bacilli bacterium]|jgi:hypothetical protein|nr:hypothetical protein [Bacilli bacterium]HPZ27872.1 hypothetical protein [Bacilli bacterium]HQC90185.1 hypothetical protein [Bacilli bacterium]
MSNKPKIFTGKRVCIICEGHEETEYIKRIKGLNVFSRNYNIRVINAMSISTIFPKYQYEFSNKTNDIVLVFSDGDNNSDDYQKLKKDINEHHDNDVASDIIFFANPCTMQIILSHFDAIRLSSRNKKKNAPIIKRLTGIDNYHANKDQIDELMKKIIQSNYQIMKANISTIVNDDTATPSTNFLRLIEYLENDDPSWLDTINQKIFLEK